MINDNINKVKYYQNWYGEKCPYSPKTNNNNNNNKYYNEEREYTPSITKGIPLNQQQQRQLQQQGKEFILNKHHEVILGPKRSRPNSAMQSSSKGNMLAKRPNSAIKRIQQPEITDEIIEENAVLTIK